MMSAIEIPNAQLSIWPTMQIDSNLSQKVSSNEHTVIKWIFFENYFYRTASYTSLHYEEMFWIARKYWIELKQIVEWKCEPIFHVKLSINA